MKRSLTTDSKLLGQLAAEDEQAWSEFHSKYRKMICSIGKKRGISPDETEDLIQEVMLICCRRIKEFTYDREKGHFRSYLTAIIHNVSWQLQRKRKNLPPVDTEYDDSIDKLFMEQYEKFLINALMKKLKERVNSQTFSTFEMLYIQQLPVEEVCKITRKSPGAVYLIKMRCLRILRQCIAEIPEAADQLGRDNSSKNA